MDKDNSFSTIEKLVDFGMGMSIAQQMINTMNHSINNMVTPGINNTISHNLNTPPALNQEVVNQEYFIVINKNQAGPFTQKELSTLVITHKLDEETLVWRTGLDGWKFAKDVPDVYKIIILNK